MNRKIKHEQYQVMVCFKTDNILNISAEFTPTNEHFVNNSVQLMRINKDTVIASLERKSQKHLRCQFEQVVQDGKKCLQIVFIVNFDFLPEFREEIRLQYVQLKDSLKNLNLQNMQAEISQIERAINSIDNNGSTFHLELASNIVNSQKKQVFSRDLNEGKYIMRCSGTINNPTGIASNDKISFYILPPGQKEEHNIQIKTNSQAGYQYPFFFSDVFSAKDGPIKVKLTSTINNATVMNLHFVLNRVIEVN